jgi:nucleolar protein 4
VAGRPVSIALAVSKDEAAKMMQKEAKHWKGNMNKEERDKRNLYLAKEGQVHENSPAAVGVSKSDMEKRKRGDAERQARLKNPNYFISKTRLSVRNVPAEFDSKLLKRAFLDATQKRASKNATPKIVNCKLLVDTSKGKGADIGIQKHKGIGFVEFDTHEEAMTALRAMNNNPEVFSKQKRPIVEFAVEDARAVKKLEKRKSDRELQKKRNKDENGGAPEDNDDDGNERDDARPTKRNKSSIEGRTFPSERVAKKVQRNLDRKKIRNEQRKKARNGGSGEASTEITDKFKKRKQEHAAATGTAQGENTKRAKKVVSPAAAPVVIENTNKRGKHRGDNRDATDDLIDKHMSAMSAGLSNWL